MIILHNILTATSSDLLRRHVWPSEWKSISSNAEEVCGVLYPLGFETFVLANPFKASHLIIGGKDFRLT